MLHCFATGDHYRLCSADWCVTSVCARACMCNTCVRACIFRFFRLVVFSGHEPHLARTAHGIIYAGLYVVSLPKRGAKDAISLVDWLQEDTTRPYCGPPECSQGARYLSTDQACCQMNQVPLGSRTRLATRQSSEFMSPVALDK